MQSSFFGRWWLKIATFSAAALAAASLAFWVLKWQVAGPQAPVPPAPLTSTPKADARAVARLLGGGPTALAGPGTAPTSSASPFKLVGVVAESGRGGYALIATNNQPAKPYRVGAAVSDTLVLQSVAARSAALATDAQAPASVQLHLPELAPAQTPAPSR